MALQQIELSVVITTYNSENTILEVLKAMTNIPEVNAEIIIVDDCSSDNTVNLIRENFGNALIISKDSNSGGPADSRNIGLEAARSDYVMFCDADDMILPTYIPFALSQVREGQFDIFTGLRSVVRLLADFDMERSLNVQETVEKLSYRSLCLKDRVTFSGTLVNRALLKFRFDNSAGLHGVEDYLFFLNNVKAGLSLGRLNDRVIGYLVSGNNISGNKLGRLEKFFRMNRIHGRDMFSSVFFTITHYSIALLEKILKKYY